MVGRAGLQVLQRRRERFARRCAASAFAEDPRAVARVRAEVELVRASARRAGRPCPRSSRRVRADFARRARGDRRRRVGASS